MGLIDRIKSWNKPERSDFERDYETYYSTIYRRIAYLTGDVHVAEELAQEVFIKLYQSPPKHENTIAWLNTVAARTAYNYLRDDQSHRKKETDEFAGQWVTLQTPETELMEAESLKLTHEALKELSPRDRTCLLMKHSGYKYAEIAECLNVDIGAVGTIISRASAKFKNYYEQRLEQGGLE